MFDLLLKIFSYVKLMKFYCYCAFCLRCRSDFDGHKQKYIKIEMGNMSLLVSMDIFNLYFTRLALSFIDEIALKVYINKMLLFMLEGWLHQEITIYLCFFSLSHCFSLFFKRKGEIVRHYIWGEV